MNSLHTLLKFLQHRGLRHERFRNGTATEEDKKERKRESDFKYDRRKKQQEQSKLVREKVNNGTATELEVQQIERQNEISTAMIKKKNDNITEKKKLSEMLHHRIANGIATESDMETIRKKNDERIATNKKKTDRHIEIKKMENMLQLRIDNCTATDSDMEMHRKQLERKSIKATVRSVTKKTRSEEEVDAPVNLDAKTYSEMYDNETLFQICAICGTEGSQQTSVSLQSCVEQINESKLSEYFSEKQNILNNETSTVYDNIFSQQLDDQFINGLLKGIDNICKSCFTQLPKIKKRTTDAFGQPLKQNMNVFTVRHMM